MANLQNLNRLGGKVGRGWRSTPPATVSPTTFQLAWAAGFIEGEGGFSRSGPDNGSEVLRVSQVQREPLDRLAAMFGGIVHQGKNINYWHICGARARGVLMTIYNLMSPRRKAQIREVMQWQHS